MRVSTTFVVALNVIFVSALNVTSTNRMPAPKCSFVTPVERLKSSKAVFLGEAVDVSETEGIQVVSFRVYRSWKNASVGKLTVTNFVHHEGPYFQRGKSYLVYALERNGKLSTGGCSGTVEVAYAQNEIKQLDKWKSRRKSAALIYSDRKQAIREHARSITSAWSGLAMSGLLC